jgi:transposase
VVLEGNGCAARMLGLGGFEVLACEEVDGELHVLVQTPDGQVVGCGGCGVRAESKGRRKVRVRDLPVSGRPVVLVWRKRLWRCNEPLCPVRTWTEPSTHVAPRAVLTGRARAEICRRVGEDADSVAQVARDYGVGWHTTMGAVREHGQGRVGSTTRPAWMA